MMMRLPQVLFSVWVTSNEHYWVISGERRRVRTKRRRYSSIQEAEVYVVYLAKLTPL
jgi:hypothetical protein